MRSRISPGRVVAWAYLVIVLVATIFPFYWIVRTALSNNYAMATDPSSLVPVDFTLGAFKRALGLASPAEAAAQGGSAASIDLLSALRNSIVYAVLLTVCTVFFSALAAFAFSRLRWKGRNAVFAVLLSALMVPQVLTLLPNFVLVKDLGLLNTFGGMILPTAFFSAFNIFFLRQFMLGLSNEVEEAAIIDGAGPLRVCFRIVLPMSTAPIATLALLTFITTWNDYLWPLLVTNDDVGSHDLCRNLAVGVMRMSSTTFS